MKLLVCSLLLVITILLSFNIWLVARVTSAPRGSAGRPTLLRPDDSLKPFDAVDERGKLIRIEYSAAAQTLLYVMSPQCQWCERNVEDIKSLAQQLHGRAQIIGLSLTAEGLTDHLSKTGYPFPVLRPASHETIASYGLGPTPHTIAVDQNGRVQRTWLGVYSRAAMRDDLEAFWKVKLPNRLPLTTKAETLKREAIYSDTLAGISGP